MAGVLVIFLPDESRPKFVCPAIVATGMHRASGWGCFLGCPPPSPPLPQGPSGPQWVKGTIPTLQGPNGHSCHPGSGFVVVHDHLWSASGETVVLGCLGHLGTKMNTQDM